MADFKIPSMYLSGRNTEFQTYSPSRFETGTFCMQIKSVTTDIKVKVKLSFCFFFNEDHAMRA